MEAVNSVEDLNKIHSGKYAKVSLLFHIGSIKLSNFGDKETIGKFAKQWTIGVLSIKSKKY